MNTSTSDRYAYERAVLRYMLTVRTPEGLQVVRGEVLLREFVDDLSTRTEVFSATVLDLVNWGMGRGGKPRRTAAQSLQSDLAEHRVMVSAFSYGYNPDWLCASPSPLLGAWDRFGKRVV